MTESQLSTVYSLADEIEELYNDNADNVIVQVNQCGDYRICTSMRWPLKQLFGHPVFIALFPKDTFTRKEILKSCKFIVKRFDCTFRETLHGF